ncbi:hypothetical protein AXG93_960s1420 [Marchantia polymorpha subsp. ruderalis]|uniref:Uncharacterized protein n=1 Tax=Marchantia polymorpha subsp. ruderalis TaxID=1480154 RepID=A0A176VFA3_MARPO|nr:hypothetical protein AXG93_960s1420 [Marchantia polymorpha subsp. ruderalis]
MRIFSFVRQRRIVTPSPAQPLLRLPRFRANSRPTAYSQNEFIEKRFGFDNRPREREVPKLEQEIVPTAAGHEVDARTSIGLGLGNFASFRATRSRRTFFDLPSCPRSAMSRRAARRAKEEEEEEGETGCQRWTITRCIAAAAASVGHLLLIFASVSEAFTVLPPSVLLSPSFCVSTHLTACQSSDRCHERQQQKVDSLHSSRTHRRNAGREVAEVGVRGSGRYRIDWNQDNRSCAGGVAKLEDKYEWWDEVVRANLGEGSFSRGRKCMLEQQQAEEVEFDLLKGRVAVEEEAGN